MRLHPKYLILLVIVLLGVLIISAKTTWRACKVCGVQEYERTILGKPIELISKREYDEFGSYAQWKLENDTIHSPHEWVEIIVETKDFLKEE